MKHARILVLTVFGLLCAAAAGAQAFVDIEGGAAFTGYNDVAIPAETGTVITSYSIHYTKLYDMRTRRPYRPRARLTRFST